MSVPKPKLNPRLFFVTVTSAIGKRYKAGYKLLIDPERSPKDGDYVLVGDKLEPWSGQSQIRGVEICTYWEPKGLRA